MPLYRYTALTLQGNKQKGTIEAFSLVEAKEKLRGQNAIVLKLSLFKNSPLSFSKKKKFSTDSLITFTLQLAELLNARVPLYESLLSLEEMYRGEEFHYIILTITEDIQKGSSLSQALTKFPSSFNTLYLSLVKTGESIGALNLTLLKLSTLLTKQNQLRKKLITSLIYPSVLIGFSLIVIAALLFFVVPSLEALFEEGSVNGFTSFIFALSHFILQKYLIYLPTFSALVLTGVFLFKKKREQILDRIMRGPLIKKIAIESGLARFTRTLSTLLEGGITMKEALHLAKSTIGLCFLEKVISDAEQKIVEGSLLSVELKKSALIPPLVSRMIAVGEEGGGVALMLSKVAAFYEEEVEKKLSRLIALSTPCILLIMGFIVGIIMMGVILPLTDVSSFINQ